jgi:hypothetical protein
MNDTVDLLAETLGDGNGETFARIAAAYTRRRQTGRKLVAAGLAAVAVVAALLTMRQPRKEVPDSPSLAANSTPPLEIISDEELIAQLKSESVLILKDQSRITDVVFLADNRRLSQPE